MSSDWKETWLLFNRELGKGKRANIARVVERSSPKKHGVLKLLQPSFESNHLERQKFLKEINSLKRLKHPGLPALLDFSTGQSDERNAELFYIRQFVDGLALDKLLPGLHYQIDEAIIFVLKLLEIVAFIHAAEPPVYHRDIKPQNIIILKKLDPILIDFGLAYSEDGTSNATVSNPPNTVGNNFLRLPGKDSTSGRLDIALCCGILCYLLTHKFPGSVLVQPLPHRRDEWATQVSPSDKELLSNILDHGLALNEGLRFSNCVDIVKVLHETLGKIQRVSALALVALSPLSKYAQTELASDLIRYEHLNQSMLEVFSELADTMESSVSEPGYTALLEEGSTFLSHHDGKPILGSLECQDIVEFLQRSAQAPGDRPSLDAAMLLLPPIIDYVRSRIREHKAAISREQLSAAISAEKESVKLFEALMNRLGAEVGLSEIPKAEVTAYQDYIDTINIGFDGEFAALKNFWYPQFWKFGAAIHHTHQDMSSHLLFNIPKGVNSPLLLQVARERSDDWQAAMREIHSSPLGEWSALFPVIPIQDSLSTSFMRDPKKHADQFLYEHYSRGVSQQLFPLYGELLCTEQLFEFADLYSQPLNLLPSDDLDVQLLLEHIEDDFVRWFVPVVKSLNTTGFVVFSETALQMWLNAGVSGSCKPIEKILDEDEVIEKGLLRCWSPWMARISCHQLLSKHVKTIRRPYQMYGPAPVWILEQVDTSKLKYNLSVVLKNVYSELEALIRGNGLSKLLIADEFSSDVSILYRFQPDKWPDNRGEGDVQEIRFAGKLPNGKVTIEHADPVPLDMTAHTVCGYKMISARHTFAHALPIFSTHPIREHVYQLLGSYGKEFYDPQTSSGKKR